MFEGDKWARQSAIAVVLHAAAWIGFKAAGINAVESFFLALGTTALIIVAIHRSNGNQMFKNKRWQDEAMITLGILGITSFFMSAYFFPVTIGVTHALVWYIRKRTGGDKKPISHLDDVKIGSPF